MQSILQNEKWYWKTIGILKRYRFHENISGKFIKKYSNNFSISIDIEECTIDYGKNTNLKIKEPSFIQTHEDLVVLYAVDLLLKKKFTREDFILIENSKSQQLPDIVLKNQLKKSLIAISCFKWGNEYDEALVKMKERKERFFKYYCENGSIRFHCIFSCLLDGGLPHIKYAFYDTEEIPQKRRLYFKGIFEEEISYNQVIPTIIHKENINQKKISNEKVSECQLNNSFLIIDDEIVSYFGDEIEITIPSSIKRIGIGAFWNCEFIKNIQLNEGLIRIGGDAFYKCDNLEYIEIPSTVREIGNDPFAGCPKLKLRNKSQFFSLEDGILYNFDKSEILHYPMNKKAKFFSIPNTVQYINKHTFFGNHFLRTLIIPESAIWMENNLFSGCNISKVINKSPYYSVEQGVLYDHEKAQVFSVFDHNLKRMKLPDSVKLIGKNSFFGCENLEYLHIPKNVKHIGYNPFVKCLNLKLSSESSKFQIINGMLVDSDRKLLVFCPNVVIRESIEIPSFIRIIGRNSFSFCSNLKKIIIPKSVQLIERGAFANCTNLEEIQLPKSVKKIEKWAFCHCLKLEKIRISNQTQIAEHIFTGSPTKIIRY